MATMSLGIGGAETHIVELSKELVRRGHSVTIVSDGGDYLPSLESAGVEHVRLPLDSKRPDKALRAYFGVKKLIKERRFDVVHSHSRISSFICDAACEKLGVRFVTTCHGVYDMNAAWRRLSRWGLYSLAVSYDTKDYLVREYGIPGDNVELTINGIDTDRFSPMPAGNVPSGINTASGHRVIYVSRIDEASSHVAFMLAEKAPELAKEYPDLEIEIVGGGDAYDRLKKAAEDANSKIGRDAVKAVGSVTDVEDYLRSGKREDTVFVGVSRAALEAMACCLPAVLAGSQGYIGIFDSDTVSDALDTNLCGRGRRLPDADTVANDIRRLFSMSEERRLSLGSFGRAFVRKHFTVGRMADDAETLYDRVRPFRPRYKGEADVMLAGYYGFGNIGDDSLLWQITGSLKALSPDLDIVVLAHKPKKISSHGAVRAIGRFRPLKIKKQMRRTSMLINGGGSLLQNSTSMRSLYYYTYIINSA
ncbi:MAG: glycosyltransferase, partial [Clostridiales bacterium]|nr:glycosyltransferase [Clostridiales bacterium]